MNADFDTMQQPFFIHNGQKLFLSKYEEIYMIGMFGIILPVTFLKG
jgi:hypothetical protein